MQTAITKQQLRRLNEHCGQLDMDRNLVFVQFVGRLHIEDGLYHGALEFAEPDAEQTYEFFSVAELLAEETHGDTIDR